MKGFLAVRVVAAEFPNDLAFSPHRKPTLEDHHSSSLALHQAKKKWLQRYHDTRCQKYTTKKGQPDHVASKAVRL